MVDSGAQPNAGKGGFDPSAGKGTTITPADTEALLHQLSAAFAAAHAAAPDTVPDAVEPTTAGKGAIDPSAGKGTTITPADTEALLHQLSDAFTAAHAATETGPGSGISKGALAGIAAGVASLVIAAVFVLGGSSSNTSTTADPGSRAGAAPAADSLAKDATYSVSLVTTAVVDGQSPVEQRNPGLTPPPTVGARFTGTLTFPTGCSPKRCEAAWSSGTPDSLGFSAMMIYVFDRKPVFTFHNGSYELTKTASVGCAGVPATNGLPNTTGTIAMSFQLVTDKGANAPRLVGTAKTAFSEPYVQLNYTLPDGGAAVRYCSSDSATFELSGAPA